MSNLPSDGTPLAASPLTQSVLEIDTYTSGLGWDQPARLFALVDTAQLRAQEPGLAGQLGLEEPEDGTADPQSGGPNGAPAEKSLTSVEQEELPAGVPLDEFLATIAWPEAVVGCALTVERLMLPSAVEENIPEDLDADELTKWVAEHPERQEVRITEDAGAFASPYTSARTRIIRSRVW